MFGAKKFQIEFHLKLEKNLIVIISCCFRKEQHDCLCNRELLVHNSYDNTTEHRAW